MLVAPPFVCYYLMFHWITHEKFIIIISREIDNVRPQSLPFLVHL